MIRWVVEWCESGREVRRCGSFETAQGALDEARTRKRIMPDAIVMIRCLAEVESGIFMESTP